MPDARPGWFQEWRSHRASPDPVQEAPPLPVSGLSEETEPHYACPDCGQPCFCSGPVRFLPHRPCGVVEL